VHPGWARTGQSFNVYATGSSGHTGRHPVCRAYGTPKAGLDSHFYSASMEECYSTLSVSMTRGCWRRARFFEMDLPDPVTGACPSGDVPVYRVWNKRTDSNHRYTTSIAIRDQMVARGYIAEGYGPNNVHALRVTVIRVEHPPSS
jgi:serine protease